MTEKFYKELYKIRRVEEEIARVYPTDKIKSPIHLSIGQEAVSVGVCQSLKKGDIVFGTYRGHATYLAKGGNLKKMIAELYGKATGTAKGKAGSMHLIDYSAGVLGGSAVVGTTIPQAVGYAMALKMKKSQSLVVCFLGDGSTEEGVFHESLNFAALKQLPVIFVCENNTYAIHSPQKSRQAYKSVDKLASIYGVPAKRITDGNVFTIYKNLNKAVSEVRRKPSPRFFEILTYRLKEHVGPGEDFQAGYRSQKEANTWIKNDPVKKVGKMLKENKRKKIELEVEKEIAEAFQFAEDSPFPDDSELYTDLYKENV